jgi:choline dehydrogenase
VIQKAWRLHAPTAAMVKQFDLKYDLSYWGNSSGVDASFPTFSWPFLSPSSSLSPQISYS